MPQGGGQQPPRVSPAVKRPQSGPLSSNLHTRESPRGGPAAQLPLPEKQQQRRVIERRAFLACPSLLSHEAATAHLLPTACSTFLGSWCI